MRRLVLRVLLPLAVVLAVGGFFVAKNYFWPERSVHLLEAPPTSDSSAEVLAQGEWKGEAGHRASGLIRLLRQGPDTFVRLENFSMTDGPAVFLYLTPSREADTASEVSAGLKVRIDGGAEGGELTKRGAFNQKLPAGTDMGAFRGAAAWCEDFRVPFATAPLDAA